MNANVLAIDDDPRFLQAVKKNLEARGLQVDTCQNPLNTLQKLQNSTYDCILLDIAMPGIDGLTLLPRITKVHPTIPVIMISAGSAIQKAVEAIKKGAYDFVEKPFDSNRLLIIINNALQKQNLLQDRQTLFLELQDRFRLIGDSPVMKNLRAQIQQAAITDAKVLVQGESGTGKELVAWAIHHNSKRSGKTYLSVNCAAIPDDLLESGLFGYKKGAFTGAHQNHIGKFEAADGGTLVLDEIGDMSFALQAKLLRVLQNDEIEPVGESHPRKINVRIIAVTNKDLRRLIEEGKFREDLFFRLNVVKIEAPPLRDHSEDILPLARFFIQKYSARHNKRVYDIHKQAETLLTHFHWPGNVRQLENMIEKIVVMTTHSQITLDEAMEALETKKSFRVEIEDILESNKPTLREAREAFERCYINKILKQNNGRINPTTKELGIDRSNLFRKMRQYGLKVQDNGANEV